MLLTLIYSHMPDEVKSNLAFKAGGTDGTSKASFRRWKGAAKQLANNHEPDVRDGTPNEPCSLSRLFISQDLGRLDRTVRQYDRDRRGNLMPRSWTQSQAT